MVESGRQSDGSWMPVFEGQRPPFEPGNQVAVTHGAYSTLSIGRRAVELAEEIRAVVPVRSPADEPTIRLLAQTLAQVERGIAALEQLAETVEGRPLVEFVVQDADNFARLRSDVRGWVDSARRLANDLGLTPTSRARLGLNLAATRREMSVIEFYEQRAADGLPLFPDEVDP